MKSDYKLIYTGKNWNSTTERDTEFFFSLRKCYRLLPRASAIMCNNMSFLYEHKKVNRQKTPSE